MTGALARDRDLAAKATQGEWALNASGLLIYRLADNRYIAEWEHVVHTPTAEHIIRLHNRQPLYDDAVSVLMNIATKHEMDARGQYRFNESSAYLSIEEWRRDHATECDVCSAAFALDKEEPR